VAIKVFIAFVCSFCLSPLWGFVISCMAIALDDDIRHLI